MSIAISVSLAAHLNNLSITSNLRDWLFLAVYGSSKYTRDFVFDTYLCEDRLPLQTSHYAQDHDKILPSANSSITVLPGYTPLRSYDTVPPLCPLIHNKQIVAGVTDRGPEASGSVLPPWCTRKSIADTRLEQSRIKPQPG